MKKVLVITLLLLSGFNFKYHCYALNVDSHKMINERIADKTINGFSLDNYLKDYLGFSKGKKQIIDSKELYLWLGEGGEKEDSPILRAANHFHNPVNDNGWGSSAIDWALMARFRQWPAGYYAWEDVRLSYLTALKFSYDSDMRNKWFAETFRGIGQLMHLVEDMSVPEHTRNDGHDPSEYEDYITLSYNKTKIDGLGAVGAIGQLLASPGTTLQHTNPIANFFDTGTYNGKNPDVTPNSYMGLAEYTNANFLSADTMFKGFAYPSKRTSVLLDNETIEDPRYPESPEPVFRQYYRKIADGETGKDINAKGYRLACVSFTDHYTTTDIYGNGVFREYSPVTLDDNVFEDYATLLMPRAVGYSAGLLNYFFRGTLKVTEAVAIAGDESGIKKITAKAVNTIPNDNTPNGEVFAFARYKTSSDAQDYSYAVSLPATDAGGTPVTSIERSTEAEMTFDFSGNRIPADVLELYLHVVYYGTLGNEQDTGIAIGMDVVPLQYVLLQSGDYYTVFSALTSTVVQDIKNPLYGQKKNDGSLKYPNATEYYHFPNDGICGAGRNECPDFDAFLCHFNTLETIPLFEELTDPNFYGFDNKQQKLPQIENEPPTRQYPNLTSGTGCSGPINGMLIPATDGYAEDLCKSYTEHWSRNKYVLGRWNKISKHENVIYASSYEEYSDSDNTKVKYTGSWVRDPVVTGCEGILEDPYNKEQCDAQCTCNQNHAGQTTMVITGEHDDTTYIHRTKTSTKHTPLGQLWDIPYTDMDCEENTKGNVFMACTYSVEQCGIQAANDGACGGYYHIYTKDGGVYNWNNPYTLVCRNNMKTIIEHPSKYDYIYNAIIGQIYAESQQILQIHYHALDIQEKDYTDTTRIAPEIYVHAQLNRQPGVYDKENDRINFTTQDGMRNEDFESAITSLIEYSMRNSDSGITPFGIEASFVIVK